MILEIVSPEASLFKGEITSIALPGVDGDFQILNNHAPIVSTLQKGKIRIQATRFDLNKDAIDLFTKIDSQNYSFAINSGTLEMKDNKVIVLVD